MTTRTTYTIGVPDRRMLAFAIEAVLPHAGRDDTLPVLETVAFQAQGGILALTATDRYSLARYRIELSPDTGGFLPLTLLPRARAVELAKMLKAPKSHPLHPVTLTVEQQTLPAEEMGERVEEAVTWVSKLTVNVDTYGTAPAPTSVYYLDLHGQFPAVENLVRMNTKEPKRQTKAEKAKDTVSYAPTQLSGPVGITAENLAKLAKASANGMPLLFWFNGETKPVHVTSGGDFYALVMPVRNAGDFPVPSVPFALPEVPAPTPAKTDELAPAVTTTPDIATVPGEQSS